jgi:hypothetical protein
VKRLIILLLLKEGSSMNILFLKKITVNNDPNSIASFVAILPKSLVKKQYL